jgi:hypothetical protein
LDGRDQQHGADDAHGQAGESVGGPEQKPTATHNVDPDDSVEADRAARGGGMPGEARDGGAARGAVGHHTVGSVGGEHVRTDAVGDGVLAGFGLGVLGTSIGAMSPVLGRRGVTTPH